MPQFVPNAKFGTEADWIWRQIRLKILITSH